MDTIHRAVESLLFISHKPLSIKELAKLTESSADQVVSVVTELVHHYRERSGGIELLQIGDSYQFATSGDMREVVERLVKHEMTGELTRPSLETLTVIAYRGPISRAELELIRGVNCSIILRNLLMRGLIEATEDKERVTTVYTITFNFLKHLGLQRIEDLPDFEKLNRNNNLDALLAGLVVGGDSEITPTA